MIERDKIINIIEQNKYCDVNTAANCRECKYSKELENYKDMGCSSLKTADALLAANIGDVTAWKGRAEKEKAEKNKWKCTANDWKQRFESREKQLGELRTTSCDVVIRKNKVISEQKAEIVRLTTERDEHKHRAELAEKERDEWKERAERMHKEALKQKQRVSDSKHSEDTMRNQLECAMGMASEMEYAKRALEILYMSGAITEETFRDAVKQAKLEIEEEEADDR